MFKHVAAIVFIYLCVCLAWVILGNTVLHRSYDADHNLSKNVEHLWGTAQTQGPPAFYALSGQEKTLRRTPINIAASAIDVSLALNQRKKGLLWYPTYHVKFSGAYDVENTSDQAEDVECNFKLPSVSAVYDNLKFIVDGKRITEINPDQGMLKSKIIVPPHQKERVSLSYDSQGLNEWRYGSAEGISQVRDFSLTMNTDFAAIDFPEGTRSATTKTRVGDGWRLGWKYDNTVSGNLIGLSMPRLLNPGPWVSDVSVP